MSGCVATGLHTADFERATVRSTLAATGIVDAQDEFYEIFCDNYSLPQTASGLPCESWLTGKRNPSPVQARGPRNEARRIKTIVFIPGIFGECVGKWVTPFSRDYPHLEALGYRVDVINVTGRGSAAGNAKIIHEFFAASQAEQVLVVAYSKGATDFMVAAAQPEAQRWAHRVAAFATIAGVVNGTPLASRGAHLYKHFASMPHSWCGPGDGGGVDSLTYQSAMRAATRFAAVDKPYRSFSVAAVGDGAAINPVLRPSYEMLSGLDQRNDGQVLVEDTIVPGSTFLGMFKADHWSITLAFEESTAPEMRALGKNNSFPRRSLMLSLLDFINGQPRAQQ